MYQLSYRHHCHILPTLLKYIKIKSREYDEHECLFRERVEKERKNENRLNYEFKRNCVCVFTFLIRKKSFIASSASTGICYCCSI